MAGVLEIFIMFMKVMFSGAGAIAAFLVFCAMAYIAAIVIKSALQAALQGAAELLIKWQREKDKNKKEKKEKGKKGKTA